MGTSQIVLDGLVYAVEDDDYCSQSGYYLLGASENEAFGETAAFEAGSYGLNWGNLR